MYYYEVHICMDISNNYSVGIKSPEQLSNKEVVALGLEQNKLTINMEVCGVDEILETTYLTWFSGSSVL